MYILQVLLRQETRMIRGAPNNDRYRRLKYLKVESIHSSILSHDPTDQRLHPSDGLLSSSESTAESWKEAFFLCLSGSPRFCMQPLTRIPRQGKVASFGGCAPISVRRRTSRDREEGSDRLHCTIHVTVEVSGQPWKDCEIDPGWFEGKQSYCGMGGGHGGTIVVLIYAKWRAFPTTNYLVH
ncbi:hypothetical protein ASPBRDRAFT_304662 [Aspergillus brasiliensis CBS 101740]|uniref:Uncharacterized protein n=1 Tax=Aspergillus brasiliensis (strain CBS 101740 / IMI 381727 / IBT 21946) TaxID=767769 RepID=A0A1L9UA42_ASPBC|nr:hypothetical protein ASPBRDRAFT_304662 [Aspergillus brasiliensis CBS 101740]